MTYALEARKLSAGYGPLRVLHDIDLAVAAGERVGLVGLNGHGKTTLLRSIVGFVDWRRGEIELDGKSIIRTPAYKLARAGVVLIPQGDALFPGLSVKDNLDTGAFSGSWRERNTKLAQVFRLFPLLAERKKQLARSLSGGERRMLALGRGMMGKARIFMIDEPSLGLAPLVIEQVYETIREIRRTGLSLLLVEENANHIAGLADRVYLLEAGALVREGTADELLQNEALLAAYLG